MFSEMHKYLCWLDQVRGIGRKTRLHLIQAACRRSLFSPDPDEEAEHADCLPEDTLSAEAAKRLYDAAESELRFWCTEACRAERYVGRNGAETVARLLLSARKQEPGRVEEDLMRAGISFSCIIEDGFPDRLREIPDPPFGIYCRGRVPFQSGTRPAAAVIGARLASGYGREQARRFSKALASRGIDIISGMARGIDGIAQKAALDAGGRSYAVLGCGVDLCYPEENRDLYERLLEEGGILSEFPPGTPPDSKNFPQRNRIISGLSDLVLVIEARKRSGTLITVDMALEQGREVYALPGRVSDSLSDGCNRLIRQGAGAATSPKDVLEFFFGLEEEPVRGRRGRGPDAGRAEKLRAHREKEDHHGKEEIITDAEGFPADSPGASEEKDQGRRDGQGGPKGGDRGETCARIASARSGSGVSGEDRLSEAGRRGPAGPDSSEQPEDPGSGCGSGSLKGREKDPQEGGPQSGEGRREESRGGGCPQPEQARGLPKKRPALETAVLKTLSTEDETHLERILERINLSFSAAGTEQATLTELVMALMRLQIDGLIRETASGYYRKLGRWD